MATDLTTIFGSEIKVDVQPRAAERQYHGIPGVDGLLTTHMGMRGRSITVTGVLASSGASYAAARASLQAVINSIETYLYRATGAASYSYCGTTYSNVVFDSFRIIPGPGGKSVNWTAGGYARCEFVCVLRQLL